MVGLYKDPNGDKINFMSSIGINRSIGSEPNDQVKQLQRRVSELETSLRKYVSVNTVFTRVKTTNTPITEVQTLGVHLCALCLLQSYRIELSRIY